MTVDPLATPFCENQMEKEEPPCGLPMVRIGKEGEQGLNWAWACQRCDEIDPRNSLDALPLA